MERLHETRRHASNNPVLGDRGTESVRDQIREALRTFQ